MQKNTIKLGYTRNFVENVKFPNFVKEESASHPLLLTHFTGGHSDVHGARHSFSTLSGMVSNGGVL